VDQLLATKLYIPPVRPELVSRHRLIDQLNNGLDHKLTLISAPAGFGKTTLVGEWLVTNQNTNEKTNPTENEIAWLSLDSGDNDLARFLTYFVTALSRVDGGESIGKGALGMLQSTQSPPAESVLTMLINDLAAFTGRIIFVLDDYHLIESQPIHDALGFFIENMPSQIHLVIATREDPLLPIPRLRVRNLLTELRAVDLRFTSPEVTDFLNRIMKLNLTPEDIAALETRTEGWIAGLQLAAISLQGRSDVNQLIKAFSGSHRLVLDYLIEEVLNQQTEEFQNFLLQTAILNRLTGSLCDALTGQENGQIILETLERANLFIIPLDNERHWYRYHHLFADLLRQRLHQTKSGQVTKLHNLASLWFEKHVMLDDAIEHALQAGDFERAANLIAELADALWKRGEHPKLRRWLERLTDEWVCFQPKLCFYHAWFLFSTGQQDAAEHYLQSAEQALTTASSRDVENSLSKQESTSSPDRTQLKGRLHAIRALSTSWGEDYSRMIQYASSALESLTKDDPWRSMAELVLGDAYYYNGDMQASYQTRLRTLETCRAEDDLFFFMIANLKVATSLREMGKLEQTIEICQEQLAFAKQHGLSQTIFAGWAMGLLGVALADQNDLEKALEFTTKYLELTKGNDLGFVGSSHMFKAKVQFYAGDVDGAEVTLNKLADIGQRSYLPHYISGALKAWQARICLVRNQLETVSQLIEAGDLNTSADITLMYDDVVMVRARLLLVNKDYVEASKVLESLIDVAETGGAVPRLIELLALQALAFQAQGEKTLAMQYLMRALELGEPGGYIRVFVDEGSPMARLLYETLSTNGNASDYVQRLLSAFPDEERPRSTALKPASSEMELIEPLSERELEILQLIAGGLSNQEIGSQLYLSLNTVKAHTRNIYGKLGVNSRTQATVRARALGILPIS